MTTTAFDDQFAPEPVEPVRERYERYDTATILRRNIADLEIALKQQTDRAEAAEAELAKLREQKPVAWINLNKWTPSNWPQCVTPEEYEKERELLTKLTAVYAAPVPAPAVPSGWNIRRDGDVLIVQHPDIGGCSVQKEPDWERMIPEAILYSLADALLQSRAVKDSLTTQADCRTCANRGRVNGLSQESYCDSCVYEGRGWRQNHFVDARKMVAASEEENEH